MPSPGPGSARGSRAISSPGRTSTSSKPASASSGPRIATAGRGDVERVAGFAQRGPRSASRAAVNAKRGARRRSVPGGEQEVPTTDEEVPGGDQEVPTTDEEVLGGEQELLTAKQEVPGGEQEVLSANEEVPGGEQEVLAADEDLRGGLHVHPRATQLLLGGKLAVIAARELPLAEREHALRLEDVDHDGGAELVGSSLRTVQRWSAGHGAPYSGDIAKLAAAVHPRDPELARRLAAAAGQTLESLGIVVPPPPPPVQVAPERSPLMPLLVEAVVAAAAEALDVSPRVARPAVLAAIERAKAAELSLDDRLSVLRPPPSGRRARS